MQDHCFIQQGHQLVRAFLIGLDQLHRMAALQVLGQPVTEFGAARNHHAPDRAVCFAQLLHHPPHVGCAGKEKHFVAIFDHRICDGLHCAFATEYGDDSRIRGLEVIHQIADSVSHQQSAGFRENSHEADLAVGEL